MKFVHNFDWMNCYQVLKLVDDFKPTLESVLILKMRTIDVRISSCVIPQNGALRFVEYVICSNFGDKQ